MTRPRLQATVACIVTLSLWFWRGGSLAATLAAIAATLALLAWLVPARYAPIARGLERLTHMIVAAFTWLALGFVYFGVFVPVRLWRTVCGHDPLARKHDPATTTYFSPLAPTPPRFDRQF